LPLTSYQVRYGVYLASAIAVSLPKVPSRRHGRINKELAVAAASADIATVPIDIHLTHYISTGVSHHQPTRRKNVRIDIEARLRRRGNANRAIRAAENQKQEER
jgi:hypothetical protein